MKSHRVLFDGMIARWLCLALVCVALGGCASTALVRVAREDPSDPARYVQMTGAQVSGVVTVYRSGRPLAVHLPYTLLPGDEVETAAGAVAVIRFPELGEVLLDSTTRVRVGSLIVLFGEVFARVRGLFSVESENVVAGVEGTEVAVQVAPDRSVAVTVLDGRVLCTSKTRSWEPIRLAPGQQLVSGYMSRQRPQIRPASPRDLDRLRAWVRRVETAAPPPSPHGYCCAGGSVFPSAQNACRGHFAFTEREARQQCAADQAGYCCAGGRVTQTTRSGCGGSFFPDRDSAVHACQPPEVGYCCAGGRVSRSARDKCSGIYSTNPDEAARVCASTAPSTTTPGGSRGYDPRQLSPVVPRPLEPAPPPIK